MASTSLGFYSFPSWYLQQEAKSCKRDFQASCFQIKEIFFKLFQMFSYSVKLSTVAKTLNSSNGKKVRNNIAITKYLQYIVLYCVILLFHLW